MLESCKSAKERWGGVHDAIDRWLSERQEMLVLFFSIRGLDEFSTQDKPLREKVQDFCQILMDYASAGHFEIYEQLIKEAQEFDDGGVELYNKLYPQIEQTTSIAVDFNDTFATEEHFENNLKLLKPKMSELGEALELRFQLEDKLIEELHEVHREKVA